MSDRLFGGPGDGSGGPGDGLGKAAETVATMEAAGRELAKAIDMWGMAAVGDKGNNGHDPTKFYVKATDTKGHGEHLSFKVPPDVYAQMQMLVHAEEFPEYTMPADFVRDAIVHHLDRRRGQVDDPAMREAMTDLVRRLAYEEFTKRMAEDVERWESLTEATEEALGKLSRAGAWGQMVLYVERGKELADTCPEPYRSRVLKVLEEWEGRIPGEFRG